MSHLPDLKAELVELTYDLLTEERADELRARIANEPEVAELYAEVLQKASLIADASRVTLGKSLFDSCELRVASCELSVNNSQQDNRGQVPTQAVARHQPPALIRSPRNSLINRIMSSAAACLVVLTICGYAFQRHQFSRMVETSYHNVAVVPVDQGAGDREQGAEFRVQESGSREQEEEKSLAGAYSMQNPEAESQVLPFTASPLIMPMPQQSRSDMMPSEVSLSDSDAPQTDELQAETVQSGDTSNASNIVARPLRNQVASNANMWFPESNASQAYMVPRSLPYTESVPLAGQRSIQQQPMFQPLMPQSDWDSGFGVITEPGTSQPKVAQNMPAPVGGLAPGGQMRAMPASPNFGPARVATSASVPLSESPELARSRDASAGALGSSATEMPAIASNAVPEESSVRDNVEMMSVTLLDAPDLDSDRINVAPGRMSWGGMGGSDNGYGDMSNSGMSNSGLGMRSMGGYGDGYGGRGMGGGRRSGSGTSDDVFDDFLKPETESPKPEARKLIITASTTPVTQNDQTTWQVELQVTDENGQPVADADVNVHVMQLPAIKTVTIDNPTIGIIVFFGGAGLAVLSVVFGAMRLVSGKRMVVVATISGLTCVFVCTVMLRGQSDHNVAQLDKPVADSVYAKQEQTADCSENNVYADSELKTDANGRVSFEITLPASFASTPYLIIEAVSQDCQTGFYRSYLNTISQQEE